MCLALNDKNIFTMTNLELIKFQEKYANEFIKKTWKRVNDIVSDEDAENRLNTLRVRVENGEDFAELARAHSDDMVSALRGGSLGWATPGMMVPEFEKQMNALADNEMSDVFKSRFGWHLILLHERREQNMAEEYKRSKAREQIHSRRMAEELEAWTRQLRDEAYVEYRNL